MWHVTEYCTVIGTHSTVRGHKLFYDPIPDSEWGLAMRDYVPNPYIHTLASVI